MLPPTLRLPVTVSLATVTPPLETITVDAPTEKEGPVIVKLGN
jgi:hypothetical protein